MIVTGVQASGSKGVTAVQGTVVDTTQTGRAGLEGDADADANRASGAPVRDGEPRPVVFPRSGLPMDHRPVALRHEHAAARYRSDGGGHEHPDHDDAA